MSEVRLKTNGVVIAAHGALAHTLAETASQILGRPINVETVCVDDVGGAFEMMSEAVSRADEGNGVLVLADLFGGSAANLALAQLDQKVEVVTGVNLAMVIAAIEQRALPLLAHADAVADAGARNLVVAGQLLRPAA